MMERGHHRAHERRRRGTHQARENKGKPRKQRRNEGSIMRAEVQRYKAAEKRLQAEEGTSVANRRMTIHQGIYGHGCTSGNVRRGIGMDEETKARAEANLCSILALASQHQAAPPLPATTTTSPLRFFLPKKGSACHPPKEKKVSRKRSSSDLQRASDDLPSQGPSTTDSDVPVVHIVKKPNMVSTRHPTSPTHTKPHKEGAPSLVDTASETRKDRSLLSRNKLTTTPEIARPLYEQLAASFNESLWKCANLLNQNKDLNAELVSKIHRIYACWEKRDSHTTQGQDGQEVTRAIKSHSEIHSSPPSTTSAPPDSMSWRKEVLRTPSCQDYLGVIRKGEEGKAPSKPREAGSMAEASVNKPVCPGTTIISPQALLKRHEELQAETTAQGREKAVLTEACRYDVCMLDPQDSNPLSVSKAGSTTPVFDSPSKCTLNETKRDRDETMMILPLDRASRPPFQLPVSQRSPSPAPLSQSQPECPKTVVADGLHYLERCERQTSSLRGSGARRIGHQDDIYSCAGMEHHTWQLLDSCDSNMKPCSHNGDLFNYPRSRGFKKDEHYSMQLGPGDSHHDYRDRRKSNVSRSAYSYNYHRKKGDVNRVHSEGWKIRQGRIADGMPSRPCVVRAPTKEHHLPLHSFVHPTGHQAFQNITQEQQQQQNLSLKSTSQMGQVLQPSIHKMSLSACQPKPLLQLTDPVFPIFQSDSLPPVPPPPHTTQEHRAKEALGDRLAPCRVIRCQLYPQTEKTAPTSICHQSFKIFPGSSATSNPHCSMQMLSSETHGQEVAHHFPGGVKSLQHEPARDPVFSTHTQDRKQEGVLCCHESTPCTAHSSFSSAHSVHSSGHRPESYLKVRTCYSDPLEAPGRKVYLDPQLRGGGGVVEWVEGGEGNEWRLCPPHHCHPS